MATKLGQNFLINSKVAEREVNHANISSDDVVLEIGPGHGILTKILAKKAKKVIAIEIDNYLVQKLREILPGNVELIHKDVLDVDFEKLPRFNKIVSNLPFQISSPVTFKLLKHSFDLAVLIYQKEFAQRMIAKSGSKHYSRLSVGVYYKADCKIVETVPKTCFKPQPKIDSCVIRMVPKQLPPFHVDDEKHFFNLTRELFNHRRKKIKNTICEMYKNIDFEEIPFVDRRVEELSPEQIGKLSDVLINMFDK
jgi:16S rRNA (adenine1518-N6/adenine1519-N6)-dimethyltransferase